MAMVFEKWNAPYDKIDLPNGRKMCFFVLTFDTTAVGGVAGQDYNPPTYETTKLTSAQIVSGKTLRDLWDIRIVDEMIFSGHGSSDAGIEFSAGNPTGEVRPVFYYSISGTLYQMIFMSAVGVSAAAGTATARNEGDATVVADNLSAVRFTGFLIGS